MEKWREMSEEQKQQWSISGAKRVNQQMRRMEKKGLYTYAMREIDEFLKRTNNKRLPTAKLKGARLNAQLEMIERFEKYETSTIRGTKDVFNRIFENLENKGVQTDSINKNDFMQFLYSKQFQQLKKTIDSNVLLEDYANAQEQGFSVNEIMEQYEQHLRNGLTLDEIQEKRESVVLLH